jgi:formylglycine-generating enzyme required for sulfatase activity
MADIFISYSSEDRQRVIPVVTSLERYGWSVWWDRIIPPGKTFSRVIEEALSAARCLIVLWTETSVKSDWVSNEAAEGARRKILIPALLDDVEIPFEFKRIQAANLVTWSGESDHAGFQQLVKALTELLGPPVATAPPPATPQEAPTEPTPTPTALPLGGVERPNLQPSRPDAPPSPPRSSKKSSGAKTFGAIALSIALIAGAIVMFKAELFHSRTKAIEDAEPKTKIEIAAAPAKPESSEMALRTPPAPEAPATVSEKEALPPTATPESAVLPPAATTPASKTQADDPEPLARQAGPRSAETVQPAMKGPAPEAKALEAVPALRQIKPEPQRPVRPAAKAPSPEPPAPDAKPAAPQVKPEEPVTPAKPREAAARKTTTNSIGMQFVLIPAQAGPFTMGSRLSLDDLRKRFGGTEAAYKSEKPSHPVKIERPFYLQTTPVTQGQWRKVMGANPSSFKDCGEDCPVEMVSWEDAHQFIAKLNEMEGASGYRLPTEAEWEYAGRAGSNTEFYFGDDPVRLGEYAWYSVNSGNQTHAVGQKKSNAWGLYDMSGNVWEWVEDDWHATYEGAPGDGTAWVGTQRTASRVVRGGAWGVIARYCRMSTRYYGNAAARNSHVGLRLARSLAPGP